MTDKNTPLDSEPAKKTDSKSPEPANKSESKASETTKKPDSKAPESSKKSESKKPDVAKKADSKAPVTNADNTKASAEKTSTSSKQKVSKLAIIAIFIAIFITIIHYFWQQQQSQLLTIKLSEKIDSKNTATYNQYQAQIKQVMIEQQKAFTSQLQQVTSKVNNSNQAKISELSTTVDQLERIVKQRQPSDWLIHEAEYLIRIATRTLWLEHDTTSSISLLRDADARLSDLNDPTFLPVRELVHQDIKSLEQMPTLQTDEAVLTLMAMNSQVAILPLAMVDVGAKDDNTSNELSDDLNDWQTNLAKTWEKFIDDFIRVRQRTGLIKPLISPEQQQHLRQNLNLKIQLALWAASERKNDIYYKSLSDIQLWITEFFDLKDATNQAFLESLTKLQTLRVNYDYPSELKSLTAIRTTLKNRKAQPLLVPTKKTNSDEITSQKKQPEVAKSEDKPQEKQLDAAKAKAESESEKTPSSPSEQDEQPNSEGRI